MPCGRCQACRVNKTKEWSVRLLHESEYWPTALFLTLTYNDDSLPEFKSLVKEHLVLFYKRLRKQLTSPIRHFSVGEYGDKSERPHYHAIIFGLDLDAQELIEREWPYGFTCLEPYMGLATGNYVAGYVQKKLYGVDSKVYIESNRLPPFMICSKGIGKQWCLDNSKRLLKDLSLKINGNPNGMPRYYRKLLDIAPETLQEARSGFKRDVQVFHLNRLNAHQMASFLSSDVHFKAVKKCLDNQLSEVGEDRLLDALTAYSINESRKAAEIETLARMRAIKRGSL